MYLPDGTILPPRRERGFRAWFVRWFCCGIRREKEIMKIYLEINQRDEDEIWAVGV